MTQTIKQLSFGKLMLFAFLPAILLLGGFIASMGLRDTIPPFMSFMIVALVVLVPVETGIIMAYSKKETGKANLSSAFADHATLPFGKIVLYSMIPFFIALIIFAVLSPYENEFLLSSVFKWVPSYLLISDFFTKQLSAYPPHIITISLVLAFAANGLVAPIAEELFFRGFLMPRISRFGKWVPLIITVLFSLYHLFSPWENLTRILAVYPMTYIVWKKKNIYIGMLTHCCLNIGSMVMAVILFL